MNTIIGIPAHGSGRAGNPSGRKRKQTIDKERLHRLSDQLSELVEELNDIKEDLGEMLSELEACYYQDYTDEDTPYMKMDDICGSVDSAFTELNEALDEMERLC